MNAKYRQMLKGMKNRGKREWSVYILRCADGSLYTGVAKDIENRFNKHRLGKGAAYTRTHRPVSVIFKENKLTRSGALKREAQLKSFSKKKKEKLVLAVRHP